MLRLIPKRTRFCQIKPLPASLQRHWYSTPSPVKPKPEYEIRDPNAFDAILYEKWEPKPKPKPSTWEQKPVVPIEETEDEKKIRLEKLAKKRKLQKIGLVVASILGAIGYYFYNLYDQVVQFSTETQTIESHLVKQGGTSFRSIPMINLAYFALENAFEVLDKEKMQNVENLQQVFGTSDLKEIRLLNPNFAAVVAHSCHILPKVTIYENDKTRVSQQFNVQTQSTLNFFFPVVNQVNGAVAALNVKIDVSKIPGDISNLKEGETAEEVYEYKFESVGITNPIVFTGNVPDQFFEQYLYDLVYQWPSSVSQPSFTIYEKPGVKHFKTIHKWLAPVVQTRPQPYVGYIFENQYPTRWIAQPIFE